MIIGAVSAPAMITDITEPFRRRTTLINILDCPLSSAAVWRGGNNNTSTFLEKKSRLYDGLSTAVIISRV